ncbi:hypothetical protein B0I37DRAFT_369469 [Chaetomium sp. MPI-CAGE-AT-0009]|nr:hypothetical protein B0I37DRAFT_369469 [Chaetomium sp. MPI-CAGE-AT-0009]
MCQLTLLSPRLLPPATLAHSRIETEGSLSDNAESQYGYWDLTFSGGNAASRYRWENLSATYSGTPEVVVTCKELYDPTSDETAKSCDDSSFRYEVDLE